MKIAICLPRLPLSGVATSVGIIHDGLKAAAHEVTMVSDFSRTTRRRIGVYPGLDPADPPERKDGQRFIPGRLRAAAKPKAD